MLYAYSSVGQKGVTIFRGGHYPPYMLPRKIAAGLRMHLSAVRLLSLWWLQPGMLSSGLVLGTSDLSKKSLLTSLLITTLGFRCEANSTQWFVTFSHPLYFSFFPTASTG